MSNRPGRFRMSLTADQEQELWACLHGTRRNSKFVSVPRSALEALLHDFGASLGKLPEGYEHANGQLGPR